MADRSLAISLAVIDGGRVKAELRDVGDTGHRSLQRIEDAARPASRLTIFPNVVYGTKSMSFENTALLSDMARLRGKIHETVPATRPRRHRPQPDPPI